jgi:trans-2,3-dihydro-3-hydroxyanthranilate isomerase
VKLKFVTYDVFTKDKFSGNPLAIVQDADGLSTAQMQVIAREFNLSETIFVRKPVDAAHMASVRIFFPTAEIPFAGHPTIGCAIFLAEGKYKAGCSFETRIMLEEVAGLVPVTVSRIGDVPFAMLTAPVVPYAVESVLPDAGLAARALDLSAGDIGFGPQRIGLHEGGPRFLYIPVASPQALARARPMEPYWSQMMAMCGVDSAYLYRVGEGGADYRARMFSPTAGIYEDPATGSASALLASQLLASGVLKEGTNRFALEQGMEMGRPSSIRMEADVAAGKLTAVRIGGHAVRVTEGVIEV